MTGYLHHTYEMKHNTEHAAQNNRIAKPRSEGTNFDVVWEFLLHCQNTGGQGLFCCFLHKSQVISAE